MDPLLQRCIAFWYTGTIVVYKRQTAIQSMSARLFTDVFLSFLNETKYMRKKKYNYSLLYNSEKQSQNK